MPINIIKYYNENNFVILFRSKNELICVVRMPHNSVLVFWSFLYTLNSFVRSSTIHLIYFLTTIKFISLVQNFFLKWRQYSQLPIKLQLRYLLNTSNVFLLFILLWTWFDASYLGQFFMLHQKPKMMTEIFTEWLCYIKL